MSFADFINAITSDKVYLGTAVGTLLSILADYVPQFVALEEKWKKLIFRAGCFVIALGGVYVGGLFGVVANPTFQDAYWPALVVGATAAVSGTLLHNKITLNAERKLNG